MPTSDRPVTAWRTPGCELARQPEGHGSMRVTPPSLAAAMARIELAGRTDHPHSYAGLEVDQDGVRAIVHRVPSAAFDDLVRRSAGDACVEVRDAAYAVADLTAWHDRVVADLDHWAANGVRIHSVGARHDGAGVEVGTADADRARDRLPARYGPEAPLIVIDQGPIVLF